MPSDLPPVQPIERLLWEHKSLLARLDELIEVFSRPPGGNLLRVDRKVDFAVRFMELNQETEERFLFPLVSEIGNPLLTELRLEHRELFKISDSLPVLLQLKDQKQLLQRIEMLKRELSAHFSREETKIFVKAQKSLSPAQLDILRIKFATRSVV